MAGQSFISQGVKFLKNLIKRSVVTKGEILRVKGPELHRAFLNIKKEMINELLDHAVTREINNGATASSQFLPDGNLFSFIGFRAESDPISPIVEIFNKIDFYPNGSGSLVNLFIIKDFPSADDIFDVTPMPWADGRSWAKGIESGISGLGQYLYDSRGLDFSRSEVAIQIKKGSLRGGKFTAQKYISHILQKYQKRFLTLDFTDLI